MARRYLFIVLVVFCGTLRPVVDIADAQERSTQIARLFLSPVLSPVLLTPASTGPALLDDSLDAFPKPPELIQSRSVFDATFETHQPTLRQKLMTQAEPHVTWRLTALSPSADTTLISEGAFASGQPESYSQTRPLTDWHHRIRLIHERPWEKSRYGLTYQYDGHTKDRERVEAWSAWEMGIIGLKTSVTRFEDNVGRVPYRPRITTIQSQVAMDVGLNDWARLGLSYTRALARSTWEPPGVAVSKRQLDTVGISLAYNRSVWEAMLTSTYASAQDRIVQVQDAIRLHHGVSLAYRLAPELVITPSINYTQEWLRSSHIWTTTPAVGLAVTRNQLLKDIDVKATSSYAWSKGPGRVIETRRINATGSVIWHMKRFWLGNALISFDLSYVSIHDAKTPINSYEGVTGGLSFQIRFS